jgi:hypothetical protein
MRESRQYSPYSQSGIENRISLRYPPQEQQVITMQANEVIISLAQEKKKRIRESINSLCNKTLRHDDKNALCSIVLDSMNEHGSFIKNEGSFLYLDTETGKLLNLDRRSRDLPAHLSKDFGLNSDDSIAKRIMEEIRNHSHLYSEQVELSCFTKYDRETNTLYIDAKEGNIFRITADSEPELVRAGIETAIFLDNPEHSSWSYINASDREQNKNLNSLFFDKLPIDGNENRESMIALLKTYILALLFTEEVPSRPLLMFTGEKGSGKSTAMRCYGKILFGKKFDVTANINDAKDLETALVNSPFVALDNVDGRMDKLFDLIATAITGGKFKKRKLYSDDTMYDRKARATVGMTSRDSKLKRDDLNSRVLRVPFCEIPQREAQSAIERDIVLLRDSLLSEIADRAGRALKALQDSREKPYFTELRMADFAIFAQRIAPALDITEELMQKHLEVMGAEQREYAAENDSFLELLLEWVDSDDFINGEKYTSSDLHQALKKHSEKSGIPYYCKKPSSMGKKLREHEEYLSLNCNFRIKEGSSRKSFYSFEKVRENEF